MARLDSADFSLALPLDRTTAAVTEDGDGDLYIAGWASDWKTDRDDERFEPGAFDAALDRFMTTNPIVLWNHEIAKPLGRVIEAKIEKARGLWVRVRLDRATPGSWAASVIEKVRRGTLRAFSVGGRFIREGRRIVRADLRELSIVAGPTNPRRCAPSPLPHGLRGSWQGVRPASGRRGG
jgi:HK97 family phage prohead protease